MYGETSGVFILNPNTTSTFVTCKLTRLAARIDVTNQIGADLELVSAQVRRAARSSFLALPSPPGQPASYFDLDLLDNMGLAADGRKGSGAGSDDKTKMWAHLYTYPNTNDVAGNATYVTVNYKYKGVAAFKNVLFREADGTPIPIERNFRYEILFNQDVIDMPDIDINIDNMLKVIPWEDGGEFGGDISVGLKVTLPLVDGDKVIESDDQSVVGEFGVSASEHDFILPYTSTSPVRVEVISPGEPWLKANVVPINTYAAVGAFTGNIMLHFDPNNLSDRTATLIVRSADRTRRFSVSQEFDGTAGTVIFPVTVDSRANSFIVAPNSEIVFDMSQIYAKAKTALCPATRWE
jgi:hypothetical protein